MTDRLVSAVQWWKKKGKWTCSLICYDDVFSQIWLESGINLSFELQTGRYCVGYTTLSSRTSKTQAALEPWKAIEPCPSKAELKRGYNCSSCYQADLVQPCLICDGTKCLAEPSLQRSCQKATAYVYVASFGLNRVKVGVAHKTRIPQRWIEQGANLAKRIMVGNGMEVRRLEKAVHNALKVLSGLKTIEKVDTLWKKRNVKAEALALAKIEEKIQRRFSSFPFYHEPLHNLSSIYNLPMLDRKPLELKVKENLKISGKILGAKGSLLLLSIGNLPHFLNLKQLVGRKIEQKEADVMNMQTALDRF